MSRPAIATLGCFGCQTAILRAVLGRNLAVLPRRLQLPPALVSSQRRAQSTLEKRDDVPDTLLDDAPKAGATDEDQGATEKPWFLDIEPPRHARSLFAQKIPKAPQDAPSLLDPMIKYVYQDMGLDDLALFDLRQLDPPASLGPNLIMLFGTARSERHLHICSGRFARWLRRTFGVDASADGLIGAGELKTKLRRIRKKAKLLGNNSMIIPQGDNGLSTGWVCVKFTTSADKRHESTDFDEHGRMTGFGAGAVTGTRVVIQCMTEARRTELDLEGLWEGVLGRSIERRKKIEGFSPNYETDIQPLDNKDVFRHKQGHYKPQWNPRASSQIKTKQLQLSGACISQEMLEKLIAAVLRVESSLPETASQRLALLDQLLLTGHERGLSIWSTDMLVKLISMVVASPAYGPELQRTQKNLELLLVETMTSPLEQDQVFCLLEVYAMRRDWDRFWHTFHSPVRFQQDRWPALYEFAFSALAATGDARLCADALRWLLPEMLNEPRPMPLSTPLYSCLKACILAADPMAEDLLHNPPDTHGVRLSESRRLQRREFVRVLGEVEVLRRQWLDQEARSKL
ncbi:hypothetical protein CDD82_4959 [Ophiocordyceps australis]|uniref:ATPase synthesis protein 25 n=1 Tax=Ophiocordyceps australis TaxID=1399860 RepID=A0A2C5YXU3_9HYPO|nr:hypothetical protein CDD82_4959 [Ophiocordyceps australis]